MKKWMQLSLVIGMLKWLGRTEWLGTSQRSRAFLLLSVVCWLGFAGYLLKTTFPYIPGLPLVPTHDSLFNVQARTERVVIQPYESTPYPYWELGSVQLFDGCDDNSEHVSGTLNIAEGVRIEILKTERNALYITLDSKGFASVGELVTMPNKVLSDCATFVLDTQSKSYTLPFDGEVELGGAIKEASLRSALLLSGQVSIADKRILSEEYYQTTPVTLSLGDRFSIRSPSTQTSGFIYTDAKQGVQVSYRVKGKMGLIEKYKSEPIEIANGFWGKVLNDDVLMVLWAVFLAFSRALVTLVSRYHQARTLHPT